MLHRESNWLSRTWLWGFLTALAAVSLKVHGVLLHTTVVFQDQADNIRPAQDYGRRHTKGEWVRVGGFANSTYFYGQLQLLGERKVAGYLYVPVPTPKHEPLDSSSPPFPRQKQDLPRQEQIYVYGELIRPGEFRVFDKQGNLYRLLVVEGKH